MSERATLYSAMVSTQEAGSQLSPATKEFKDFSKLFTKLPGIPEHFASLVQQDPRAARILARQLVKSPLEDLHVSGFSDDPMGETHSGVISTPHFVHKYPDRLLLLFSGKCPVKCRYCTRKRVSFHSTPPFELDEAERYLLKNPQIHEVIFSGGDPFMEAPEVLARAIERLGEIGHIQKMRFHTRTPLMRPRRVNHALLTALEKAVSLPQGARVVLHINHPVELTPLSMEKLSELKKRGLALLSQSVLLRGVNDNEETLYRLFSQLAQNGVLPYYLHQLDRVAGSAHFEVSIKEGRHLVKNLARRLPRCLVAPYVLDGPSGKKKLVEL